MFGIVGYDFGKTPDSLTVF